MSDDLTDAGSAWTALIAFWSHALAAALFVSLILWRLRPASRQAGQRLLLAAFALTACWAWLARSRPAARSPAYAETARNLVWVGMLYSLSSAAASERQRGVRLVYAAVAAVLGLQLVVDALPCLVDARRPRVALTATHPAHHRRGRRAGAGPQSLRPGGAGQPPSIRLAMLALASIWVYDLNLYTVAYLDLERGPACSTGAALAVALTAPLFALGAQREEGWRIRLSRAATFQSLSLLAICAYFAVMAMLATALRGTGWDWSRAAAVAVLAVMTVAAMVLLPSARARSWAKVKLAKHLFEHRYDYRTEWLRFTDTLGRAGADAPPLGERVVKAFADILDAPGGLLLVADDGGRDRAGRRVELARRERSPRDEPDDSRRFWRAVERERPDPRARRASASGWATPKDLAHRAARLDARRRPCLGRRAADPPRHGWSAWSCSPRPITAARSTGRISTCCAPPGARRRARSPRRTARTRCRTRSGSRNSTAASPSSSTTSRISSASCRCSRAMPSATPTIPSSAPTWSRR